MNASEVFVSQDSPGFPDVSTKGSVGSDIGLQEEKGGFSKVSQDSLLVTNPHTDTGHLFFKVSCVLGTLRI